MNWSDHISNTVLDQCDHEYIREGHGALSDAQTEGQERGRLLVWGGCTEPH